jgi:uncharacterized membrane protein YhhN
MTLIQKKTGLIFSLIGDIFLMFQGELYFIFGLASFLIAHVFYISVFYQTKKYNNGPKSMLTLGSIAVTYFFYLHEAIYNDGGAVMLFAVLVYIAVIATMVYYAYLNDNAMLSLGVTLFFISDATIAFDKFIVNAPGESQWEYVVMVTYYIAQYLIASF